MSSQKSTLHPRNLHRNSYDFDSLISCVPELKHYVFKNDYDTLTINFSLPQAVKLLNKALLLKYYEVKNWDIPEGNLCPPIPGRADYVHYLADLLAEENGQIPKENSVKGLDIGTGANLVYPLIAHQSYGWKFVGTDINPNSLDNAQKILEQNPNLSESIQLKLQPDSDFIFKNIISPEDKFSFSMCNPPFHESEADAMLGNRRKNNNLRKKKVQNPKLNFGGQHSELWCEGGELEFIRKMIDESVLFSSQVLWFTSLVSKKDNLHQLITRLKNNNAIDIKTIEMAQGQKISRILAWTFIPIENRKYWF
ncbi:23S rRNA (adenine(1618)-N(6))-methyltransferase RlmF [Chryseobacterium formosus]|uniref:Ribosomal RNA large subunit methyltransferase F n=1 Tax=Chryseobacterium formosus TaxID=1537363 RepID=A0ABT3XQL5_9FLAO|nr:23S rRNA (adenine(1618)-N(6))-methyltransferase RlmF [Chryseobacterium formosus]MCX8524390.1 23S rRNA (adenine(1618)-N(6))-methyltransferase RlmF [Chryseobacterium formosus]